MTSRKRIAAFRRPPPPEAVTPAKAGVSWRPAVTHAAIRESRDSYLVVPLPSLAQGKAFPFSGGAQGRSRMISFR